MELFGFNFSLAELILLGCLFAFFLHQIYYYTVYINGVLRQKRKIKNNKVTFTTEQEPISVIICSKDEVDNLRRFLPFVLDQDYPDFEVIVINDGSTDDTEQLLKELCEKYGNLRTTFVPVGARNLSTKKLGLTLGIKASKYDWLVFTDADCMPEDKYWLARLAHNFDRQTDFVLGYGPYFAKKGFLNHLITYDTLFIALQYMGMALKGKPYMGVGRNLAYRKETFFAHKGFAATLQLMSGDDDLMVNKAATASNTRVEIAPDSITWSEPNTTFRNWFFQKKRHLSVASHYSDISKFRLALEPLSRGCFYALIIAIAIVGNWLTLAAAGILVIARFITRVIIINRASAHFGQRKYFLSLPILDIYLPLVSLYISTIGRIGKKNKMTRWK